MKTNRMKYGLMCLLSLLLVPVCAGATGEVPEYDMLLPALDIVIGLLSWHVLLLGLLVEVAFVKLILKQTILKSILIAVVMNIVSAILGAIAIPLAGLILEILMMSIDVGTYHISHWIPTFILTIMLNATFDAFAAKIFFKFKFKNLYWWLCLTNAIGLVICFLFNLFWLDHIHF